MSEMYRVGGTTMIIPSLKLFIPGICFLVLGFLFIMFSETKLIGLGTGMVIFSLIGIIASFVVKEDYEVCEKSASDLLKDKKE